MSVALPKGSWSLATAYAAAIAVTAASNASECVLTTAANTFAIGDLVEYTSGWSDANNGIYRAKAVSGTSVTLEGFDTTATANFPAGAGVGSVRKVSTWTPISQVLNSTSSGGDTQFTTYQFSDQNRETQIPTGTSAQSISLDIGDDPTLPHHAALKAAARTRALTGLRCDLSTGSKIFYNSIVSFDETPSMTQKQVMAVKASFALQSAPVRYAS